MNKPTIMDFLVELFNRLRTKSPKFFQIIQIIALTATLVTGIPDFLSMFGITLPPEAAVLANKAVAIASMVVWFISKLTVDDSQLTIAQKAKKLPLTDKSTV
jgi:hypothetical protein